MTGIRYIFKNSGQVYIAEIGLNHNGDFNLARAMIEAAAGAGAHAVKFQTFIPGDMNSVYTASLADSGVERNASSEQADFFKKFVLKEDEYIRLKETAEQNNVVFFSAPFDVTSVELLERVNVELYKIASSEVTNHVLLKKIAETGKCVIMSTGIATEDEIALAIDVLKRGGAADIVLMHCVSLYPLPGEHANLLRINSLRERFGLEVGFSDHSKGNMAAVLASVMGAEIFERHFTLSRDLDCPDKEVSLDPGEFKNMIESLEKTGKMLGDGEISYKSSEKDVAKMARRSLYANRFIPAGKIIEADDVIPKRPGLGIPVYMLDTLIGKKAVRDIAEDFLLREEYFN